MARTRTSYTSGAAWRHDLAVAATGVAEDQMAGGFVALPVASPAATASIPDIRVELRRGATTVNVTWPLQAAGECAAWLRELLR